MKKLSKIKKAVLITALSFLLLIIGINAFLRSKYVSDAAKGYATIWLEENLGQPVSIDSFSFHIFPTYLEINRFSIANKSPFKNENILNIKKIKISFRSSALLYKTLLITKLQIQEPQVWIEEDTTSGDNYSVLLSRTIEFLRRPLIKKFIKRWVVQNGVLYINSKKRYLSGEIRGIDIDNRTDIFLREHKTGFRIDKITANLRSASWHTEGIEGDVKISQRKDVSIAIRNININNKPVGAVSAKGHYREEDKRLLVTSLTGNIFSGTASGNMDISFGADRPLYNGVLEAKGLDPDTILLSIFKNLPPVKKEIDFKLSFSGEGFERKDIAAGGRISGRFRPEGDNLKGFKGIATLIKKFDSELKLKNGVVTVDKLGVSSDDAILNLSGEVKEDGIKLSLELLTNNINELTSLFNYPYTSGGMIVSGEITGPLREPSFNGELTIKNGIIKDVTVDMVSGGVHYDKGLFSIEDIIIEKGESNYNINGSINFKETDPYFDLKADIRNGSPKDIVAIFYKEIPLHIKASGLLTFKGTARDFTGDGSLNLAHGSAYGQEFDSAAVTAHLDTEKIAFPRIYMKKDKSILNGDGFISFKNSKNDRTRWSAHLTSSNIELEDINLINRGDKLPLKGGFKLDLKGNGDFSRPEIDGRMVFEKISSRDKDLGAGKIEFGIKEMVFGLNSTLFNNRAIINAKLELKDVFPFKADMELIDAPLNNLIAILRPEPFLNMPISGTGKVGLNGDLKDIKGIAGHVVFSKVIADTAGYNIFNDGDIMINYRDEEVIIDSLKIKGEDTAFILSGRFRPFKEYNLNLSGEADMRVSRLFTKELEYSKGKAYMAVGLSGDWLEPRVRGTLNIREGALRSKTISQRIEKVNISLLLSEKQIMMDKFEGVIGGGTIKGTGRIELSGFSFGQFGMDFMISNARFVYPEGFSSTIDANILLQGDAKKRFVKGDVNIKKGEYKRRVEWKSALLEFQKRDQLQKGEMPLFGETELNIQIRGKENVWVNNNTAKLPVEIDLILKGTINRPIIVGRVEAIDGEIYFRKNKFKVISGRVDFTDPEKINPVFDIQASSKVREYQIDLTLSGAIDRFNLSLVSSPSLSETDILALLTFGKTTEELAGTEQMVGTAEAASFFTGRVQDIIEERVQEIVGFERFQLDPYYYSSKASAGPRLTVSKRFWEDSLYVTYSTNLATTEEQLVEIEYILNKNISLVGERDEDGRHGVDIKFRLEFK